MKRIEEAVARAVNPLRDDWTLRQELSQELKLHLEESVECLEAEGLPPEESEAKALARFGDPEEVGKELLSANFRKMKLRGKLKLAMRIAAVPLLFLAFFIGFNIGMLAGLDRFFRDFMGERKAGPAILAVTSLGRKLEGERELTEAQRLFLTDRSDSKEFIAMRRRLMLSDPGNPVLRMQYAIAVRSYQEKPSFREFMEQEPDNALYAYMQISEEFSQAAELEIDKKNGWFLEVKDRAGLDRAAGEFLQAVRLPHCTSYHLKQMEFVSGIYPENDFNSIMQRLGTSANILLPHLNNYRTIGRTVIGYAELLIDEGKLDEAESLLDCWKPFTHHIVEESQTTIGILVACAVLSNYERRLPELYEKLGKPEKGIAAAREIKRMVDPINEFRQQMKRPEHSREVARYGGFFSNFNDYFATQITDEDMRVDRKISYALIDGIILFCFSTLMMIVTVILALIWCVMRFGFKKKGHFLYLRWKEYVRLLGYGIILPLGLFLLWTHIDMLSGRDVSPGNSAWLIGIVGVVLCLVLPLMFDFVLHRLLRKRYRALTGDRKARLPLMVYLTSKIPCWICFVLIVTGVLRLVNSFELEHYLKQDKAFLSSRRGFSAVEDEWTEKHRERLLEQLK